jgi:HlyD family secretion protein
MSKLRITLVLLAIPIIALVWWGYRRTTQPPEVAFAEVRRERLVSTLVTNGKVEPSEWQAVRAERAGVIQKVHVEKGQRVGQSALLLEFEALDAQAELAASEAAVAQARAQLSTLEQGGSSAALVEIDNQITRNQLELDEARRNYESLRRLAEKQAATEYDVAQALQQIHQLEADIEALKKKRASLVGQAEKAAGRAVLQEAQARLEKARALVQRSRVHSPISGIVYELAVREGSYANVGDLLANVGQLATVRVRVYVDEPELGRVREGMPVTITWDAHPGKAWKGTVEQTPTQVVALGTRQVGEVICTIRNPGLELLPGTNVNAEIQSQVVENGLTIPKEAVRRENGQTGVFVLRDGQVQWRKIALGASSLTRVVVEGLNEGERVALSTEQPLVNGQPVKVAGDRG